MEIGPANLNRRLAFSTASGARRHGINGLKDDVAAELLRSVTDEIKGLVKPDPGAHATDLKQILDACCLPLLKEPEVLGILVMLLGEAAARPSLLASEVARCRERALAYVAGHVGAAQRRGTVSAGTSADAICGVVATVLTGLCLTAVAEGRRPTLQEYCSVRDFLVSAYA